MLLATFAEDPANSKALQARLEQFEAATSASAWLWSRLESMAVLPANGGLRLPRELAFKGRADYWGEWKIRVSMRRLSQEDQRRYRMAGVTSSRPTLETSQEFFEWLSSQDRRVIERHIPCVLRHILLHGAALRQWAEGHPHTEFVPVTGRDGPRLASLRMVRDGLVFLRDERDLAPMVTAPRSRRPGDDRPIQGGAEAGVGGSEAVGRTAVAGGTGAAKAGVGPRDPVGRARSRSSSAQPAGLPNVFIVRS